MTAAHPSVRPRRGADADLPHLCDDARAIVAAVCEELGERFEELDIDDDPRLAARYAEEIPVTLVDGRQHDFWRFDPQRLRSALGAPPPA